MQIATVTGHVSQVVVEEGSFIQHKQSITGKTVVKSGWVLIKGVIHEEFCCNNYIFTQG